MYISPNTGKRPHVNLGLQCGRQELHYHCVTTPQRNYIEVKFGRHTKTGLKMYQTIRKRFEEEKTLKNFDC